MGDQRRGVGRPSRRRGPRRDSSASSGGSSDGDNGGDYFNVAPPPGERNRRASLRRRASALYDSLTGLNDDDTDDDDQNHGNESGRTLRRRRRLGRKAAVDNWRSEEAGGGGDDACGLNFADVSSTYPAYGETPRGAPDAEDDFLEEELVRRVDEEHKGGVTSDAADSWFMANLGGGTPFDVTLRDGTQFYDQYRHIVDPSGGRVRTVGDFDDYTVANVGGKRAPGARVWKDRFVVHKSARAEDVQVEPDRFVTVGQRGSDGGSVRRGRVVIASERDVAPHDRRRRMPVDPPAAVARSRPRFDHLGEPVDRVFRGGRPHLGEPVGARHSVLLRAVAVEPTAGADLADPVSLGEPLVPLSRGVLPRESLPDAVAGPRRTERHGIPDRSAPESRASRGGWLGAGRAQSPLAGGTSDNPLPSVVHDARLVLPRQPAAGMAREDWAADCGAEVPAVPERAFVPRYNRRGSDSPEPVAPPGNGWSPGEGGPPPRTVRLALVRGDYPSGEIGRHPYTPLPSEDDRRVSPLHRSLSPELPATGYDPRVPAGAPGSGLRVPLSRVPAEEQMHMVDDRDGSAARRELPYAQARLRGARPEEQVHAADRDGSTTPGEIPFARTLLLSGTRSEEEDVHTADRDGRATWRRETPFARTVLRGARSEEEEQQMHRADREGPVSVGEAPYARPLHLRGTRSEEEEQQHVHRADRDGPVSVGETPSARALLLRGTRSEEGAAGYCGEESPVAERASLDALPAPLRVAVAWPSERRQPDSERAVSTKRFPFVGAETPPAVRDRPLLRRSVSADSASGGAGRVRAHIADITGTLVVPLTASSQRADAAAELPDEPRRTGTGVSLAGDTRVAATVFSVRPEDGAAALELEEPRRGATGEDARMANVLPGRLGEAAAADPRVSTATGMEYAAAAPTVAPARTWEPLPLPDDGGARRTGSRAEPATHRLGWQGSSLSWEQHQQPGAARTGRRVSPALDARAGGNGRAHTATTTSEAMDISAQHVGLAGARLLGSARLSPPASVDAPPPTYERESVRPSSEAVLDLPVGHPPPLRAVDRLPESADGLGTLNVVSAFDRGCLLATIRGPTLVEGARDDGAPAAAPRRNLSDWGPPSRIGRAVGATGAPPPQPNVETSSASSLARLEPVRSRVGGTGVPTELVDRTSPPSLVPTTRRPTDPLSFGDPALMGHGPSTVEEAEVTTWRSLPEDQRREVAPELASGRNRARLRPSESNGDDGQPGHVTAPTSGAALGVARVAEDRGDVRVAAAPSTRRGDRRPQPVEVIEVSTDDLERVPCRAGRGFHEGEFVGGPHRLDTEDALSEMAASLMSGVVASVFVDHLPGQHALIARGLAHEHHPPRQRRADTVLRGFRGGRNSTGRRTHVLQEESDTSDASGDEAGGNRYD